MATIDWSTIEGYREDMTAEEKLELISNHDFAPAAPTAPDKGAEPETVKPAGKTVAKAQYDKLASELASMKKQMRARMTDEEQREADRLAEVENMKSELELLRREKTLAEYTKSYLAQGYDEASAADAAVAMADGDSDALFAIMRKQQQNAEKALRAQILKETPQPPAGDPEGKDNKQINQIRKAMGLPPI